MNGEPKKVTATLKVVVTGEFYGDEVSEETLRYFVEQDLEDNCFDVSVELLKEQDEMIPIATVAEYLADNAPPPLIVQHWESVMAWERFLQSLKGRKIRND